jgi:hypothetical protein
VTTARSSWQALLLSLLLLGLAGCNCEEDSGFCWTCGDDDDNGGDDDDNGDDDDTPAPGTPRIELVTVEPNQPPITGVVAFSYRVDDSDSSSYTVIAEFGTTGASSAFQPATLVDEFGLPLGTNEVTVTDVEGAPPIVDHEGTIKWNSTANVVATDEGVFRLCVEDPEGNVSDPCAMWPEEGGVEIKNENLEDLGAFCQPGDLNEMVWIAGRSVVPLSNSEVSPPCLNYEANDPPQPTDYSAQFLIVFVNPSPDAMGFSLRTTDNPDLLTGGDGGGSGPQPMRRGPVQQKLPNIEDVRFQSALSRDGSGSGSSGVGSVVRETCNADSLVQADVHNDPRQFYFRNTLDDEAERCGIGVNLRALGEKIAIYVDEETHLDIDTDCDNVALDQVQNGTGQPPADGVPDDIELSSNGPAGGFDNCDLDQVVGIVETNIYPKLTDLFGEPSDVDTVDGTPGTGNCRVTVFISHRVNELTDPGTTACPGGGGGGGGGEGPASKRLVKSFTEPEKDLWESHLVLNKDSNEQEIIFLYAPNPLGYHGTEPHQFVSVESYLNYEVAGQLAVALQELISYAAHRDVGHELLNPSDANDLGRPPAEKDWLLDAMSLLAADVTGFGAIAYADAWIYQDASYLLPLISNNTLAELGNRGAQYLFIRYLHDLFGDDIIWQIVNSEDALGEPLLDDSGNPTRGIDTIQMLVEQDEFADFALQWATAMAVSGMTNEVGGQLVFDSDIPNYESSATVVVSNPASPAPGELWGANGFQLGYNVSAFNRTYNGGTDPAGPTEDLDALTRTENLDYMLYHPQADFYGYVGGNYGVLVVLVSGLAQAENYLLVETSGGEELLGNVIRINDTDPANPRMTLEQIDGAKVTMVRYLGALDPQGEQRHVIGRVDSADDFTVIEPLASGDDDDSAGAGGGAARSAHGDDDDSAAEEEIEFEIADTDRYGFTLTSTTTLAMWVDRRISDIEGAATLDNPFLAVALAADVPDAADYSMWDFGPSLTNGLCADIDIYNYPLVMPTWIASQGNLSNNPIVGTYQPLAGEGGTTTYDCSIDHDQDGIPDDEEPQPTSLFGQILQRQAENLAISPNFYGSNFGSLVGGPDTSAPFWDATFIDVDSNETPDDNEPTAYRDENLGGRALEEGEEALWKGTLPPGDFIILVGGVAASVGPYDLSIKVLNN